MQPEVYVTIDTDAAVAASEFVEFFEAGTAAKGEYHCAACGQLLFMSDTNASPPVVRSCGRYVDTFRRTPDGWKMASRQILNG